LCAKSKSAVWAINVMVEVRATPEKSSFEQVRRPIKMGQRILATSPIDLGERCRLIIA